MPKCAPPAPKKPAPKAEAKPAKKSVPQRDGLAKYAKSVKFAG